MTFTFTSTNIDLHYRFGVGLLSIISGWIAAHIVASLIAFCSGVKAPRVGRNPRISGLRRARADFTKNGRSLTKEGYTRYKNSMYLIQTGDMERLVVSTRFVDELRKLPDAYLDSRTAIVERNLGWYNGVDILLKSTSHVDICRTKLVQNLGKQIRGAGPKIWFPDTP